MAGRWLFKTEPSEFSFADLEKKKSAVWDGVRNATALIHLRLVKKGDRVLVYHTGDERAVVGEARVVRGAYPDPKAGDAKLVVVDLAPVRRLASPVGLDRIKADARFRSFDLVRIGRLSVMPVAEELWVALGELAADPAAPSDTAATAPAARPRRAGAAARAGARTARARRA